MMMRITPTDRLKMNAYDDVKITPLAESHNPRHRGKHEIEPPARETYARWQVRISV